MRSASQFQQLQVVLDALVRVEEGQSERSALLVASRGVDRSQKSLQDSSILLRQVVADRQGKNTTSRMLLGDMTRVERSLANLTAWLILSSKGKISSELITCLRELTPEAFRRDFEFLLGQLLSEHYHEKDDGSENERIAFETQNPPWWVEYCIYTFGRGRALTLLSPSKRYRFVRINRLRNAGIELREHIQRELDALDPVPSLPEVYRVLRRSAQLSELMFSGKLQFQDLASYCAVVAAKPAPGETALDICAAPGAKTSAIAQMMRNTGKIVSVDLSRSRLESWRKEMERLGVEIASGVISDGTSLGMLGKHDLVLLDPPCSGTGILDQNPKMKWSLGQESISRYARLQEGMLDEAYRMMKPDGRIIYSTCSITTEENENVVSGFLRRHTEMETRPLALPHELGSPAMYGLSNCRRFFTDRDGTAGYFIAKLETS